MRRPNWTPPTAFTLDAAQALPGGSASPSCEGSSRCLSGAWRQTMLPTEVPRCPPTVEAGLSKDAGDLSLDDTNAEHELFGDLPIRLALRQQQQDLDLPPGQAAHVLSVRGSRPLRLRVARASC